ncbi:MAG: GNAT family N-acetyltransferase [Candidatus Peribacteraceae bacterium]|nr:GNAT family N-acetyltransferase [Candidatus Peribacteraceae bacterium]
MSSSLPTPIASYFEHELAGQVVAHKVSGSGLENADIRREVLCGISELMRHHVRSLLISGAGGSLNKALGEKLEHSVTHLRITPKKDIPHIEQAIKTISEVFSHDCQEMGIPFEVLPHSVTHATRLLDGHKETGGIVNIDHEVIRRVLDQGKLAILPFGGTDSSGNTLNVNADDVAARAAAATEAKKLIMYTNAEGIMKPGKSGTLKKIDFLDFYELFHLIRLQNAEGQFVIDEGMLPKLKAILEALTYGVPQVHVVRAKTTALLEELFTRTGSGTLIEKEPFLLLDFPAGTEQLHEISALRAECSEAKTPTGVPFLKPLNLREINRLLPTTLALRQRNLLVGVVYFDALKNDPETAMIGGFAVGENHQNSGYGRMLLENVLERIQEAGFKHAVSITAADPVKALYAQYGSATSKDWGDLLRTAKKRYGTDQHLVDMYSFDISNP